MRIRSAIALVVFALCAPALAADLSPEKVAKIRKEQKEAMARIEKAHGNKKPSEMSNAERREMAQERAAAEQAVLEKHGVSTRDFANYTVRMSTDDRKEAEAAEKKLEAADAAKKKAAETKPQGEVQVQLGFDEKNPVDLEESADAPPKVEYGTEGK